PGTRGRRPGGRSGRPGTGRTGFARSRAAAGRSPGSRGRRATSSRRGSAGCCGPSTAGGPIARAGPRPGEAPAITSSPELGVLPDAVPAEPPAVALPGGQGRGGKHLLQVGPAAGHAPLGVGDRRPRVVGGAGPGGGPPRRQRGRGVRLTIPPPLR